MSLEQQIRSALRRYLGNRATFSQWGDSGRGDLVLSGCKDMYGYLFTEAELESRLLECRQWLHMYSANVQTDSSLTLVKGGARFHRWMMSIKTEREKEASVGGLRR